MPNSPLIESSGGFFARAVSKFREKSRRNRIKIFHESIDLNPESKVLDLGGWDGSHVSALVAGFGLKPGNIFVADINQNAIDSACRRFGFTPILIPENGRLPFADNYFDVVFCSSVLEHVTVPKSLIWKIKSGGQFRASALEHQTSFANEIRRLGRSYYVQVPWRHFPIETHSWLPFIAYFPRRVQLIILSLSNKFWVKKTSPDFYLPSDSEMKNLFPEASLVWERQLGIRKSMIAIKS